MKFCEDDILPTFFDSPKVTKNKNSAAGVNKFIKNALEWLGAMHGFSDSVPVGKLHACR